MSKHLLLLLGQDIALVLRNSKKTLPSFDCCMYKMRELIDGFIIFMKNYLNIFDKKEQKFLDMNQGVLSRRIHCPTALLDSAGYIWDIRGFSPMTGALCLGQVGDGRYELQINPAALLVDEAKPTFPSSAEPNLTMSPEAEEQYNLLLPQYLDKGLDEELIKAWCRFRAVIRTTRPVDNSVLSDEYEWINPLAEEVSVGDKFGELEWCKGDDIPVVYEVSAIGRTKILLSRTQECPLMGAITMTPLMIHKNELVNPAKWAKVGEVEWDSAAKSSEVDVEIFPEVEPEEIRALGAPQVMNLVLSSLEDNKYIDLEACKVNGSLWVKCIEVKLSASHFSRSLSAVEITKCISGQFPDVYGIIARSIEESAVYVVPIGGGSFNLSCGDKIKFHNSASSTGYVDKCE